MLIAAVSLALIAGCSSSAGSAKEPALTPLALPADPMSVSEPLDSYQYSENATKVIRNALYKGISECIAPLGLTLPANNDTAEVRDYKAGRFGLVTDTQARSTAYTGGVDNSDDLPWELRLRPSKQPLLAQAVFGHDGKGNTPAAGSGIPPGGCQQQVSDRVYMGAKDGGETDLLGQLYDDANSRTLADSRVKAAFGDWRECMAKAGYDYAEPVDAPRDYWSNRAMDENPNPTMEQKHQGIAPSAAEVAAAVADVGCKRSTGMLATWIEADIAYQQQAVEQNATALQRYRDDQQREVRNAQQILAGK